MHFCEIDGRLLFGGALREVLLEVLAYDRRHAFRYPGSMLV